MISDTAVLCPACKSEMENERCTKQGCILHTRQTGLYQTAIKRLMKDGLTREQAENHINGALEAKNAR